MPTLRDTSLIILLGAMGELIYFVLGLIENWLKRLQDIVAML